VVQVSGCRDNTTEDGDQKGTGHTALGKPERDRSALTLDTLQTEFGLDSNTHTENGGMKMAMK
jgi:hypothetical protein